MNDQVVVLLSDGSQSDDDDIAFIGTTRGSFGSARGGPAPRRSASPVFLYGSTVTTASVTRASSRRFMSPVFAGSSRARAHDRSISPVFVGSSTATVRERISISGTDMLSDFGRVTDSDDDEDLFAALERVPLRRPTLNSSRGSDSDATVTLQSKKKQKRDATQTARTSRKRAERTLSTADNDGSEDGGTEKAALRKRKKTPEDEEEKERRKAQRQQEQQERLAAKEAEKEAREYARAEAKVAREAERSAQRKMQDANRLRVSKVEALREIEIHLAHDLAHPTSPIAGALPEIKQRVTESSSALRVLPEDETVIPGSIRFLRNVISEWDGKNKRWNPLETARKEWEPTLVLAVWVDAIVDYLADGDDLFIKWIKDVRLVLGIKREEQVFLLVRGMGRYHSESSSIVNRGHREQIAANLVGAEYVAEPPDRRRSTARVTKEMVETELLRAQVSERVFIALVDETEEIEDWLFSVAGDVALRRYKRVSKSHLAFAAPDGARNGQDARETLELMLQEIPGITPAASQTISGSYPTFRDIMEGYEAAEQQGERVAAEMIEGSEVRRLADGTATSRRVGKATSRKVYEAMRGQDPLALL